MELSKLLVAFFVIVIVLTLISILSKGQTGQFIFSPNDFGTAFAIIIFSTIVIFLIKVPKKYYRPIPSRA